MRVAACIDELVKLGMITPAHAEASLERLQSLEETQPTAGQALRYGALGALAGPLATGVGDAVKGRPLFAPAERGGKAIPFGRTRGVLGAAAVGALTGGALPFLRNRLDQAAEKRTLQQFMNEYQAAQAQKTAAAKKKEGDFSASYDPGSFRVSPYSGPLSYGPWILASMLNGGDDPSLDVTVERKKAAGALTPVGVTPQAKLTSAQNIGQPKVSGPSAPGGSIADIAKPRGYGMPMPGALKGTI